MGNKKSEKPLHVLVLEIMYFSNVEKPIAVSANDILWKIDNPEITERHLKEVLDWLVHKKEVTVYLGKYTLDRYAYLALKEQYNNTDGVVVMHNKSDSDSSKVYYIQNQYAVKKKGIIPLVFILILTVVLIYFAFSELETPVTYTVETTNDYIVENETKKLYLSAKSDLGEKVISDISYNFHLQNLNNQSTIEALEKYIITNKTKEEKFDKEIGQLHKNINLLIAKNNNQLHILLGLVVVLMLTIMYIYRINSS